jgi:hypothetical protein
MRDTREPAARPAVLKPYFALVLDAERITPGSTMTVTSTGVTPALKPIAANAASTVKSV